MFETRVSMFARWDLPKFQIIVWIPPKFCFWIPLQKSLKTTLPLSTVLEGIQWDPPTLSWQRRRGPRVNNTLQMDFKSVGASALNPSFLLLSAPYCAGPMGKLTLWRATSAIPNERRIYMIFLPPALGFVLPRKQPTKNVITFPTKSTRQKCSTNLESNWIF